ncbi:hypothetical protein ACM39_11865 [Chryseobacterium sp. FH2]|nr:hypothetical protein ACM39_11865 [Chryseobacterium sp. FH2]
MIAIYSCGDSLGISPNSLLFQNTGNQNFCKDKVYSAEIQNSKELNQKIPDLVTELYIIKEM